MQETGSNKETISIQVSLSGYAFQISSSTLVHSSGWMSADRIFTTTELQRRYDIVNISVFTPKCALVPLDFFVKENARHILEASTSLHESDLVDFEMVPEYNSVLVYSNTIGETLSKVISEMVLNPDGNKSKPLPELYWILSDLKTLTEYNKIIASYKDGYLYLAIAQGKSLLLCNSFEAVDFTTALYHIFRAMKRLQLNPEVSSISFRTHLAEEQIMELYNYFKSVEII